MAITQVMTSSETAIARLAADHGRSGLRVTNPWVVYGKDGKPNARYHALEGFKK